MTEHGSRPCGPRLKRYMVDGVLAFEIANASRSSYADQMIDLSALRRQRELGVYSLRQLGTSERVPFRFYNMLRDGDEPGWLLPEIITVAIQRTAYLNSIIPCSESERAIKQLRAANRSRYRHPPRGKLKTIDKGHIYQMEDPQGRALTDPIVFIKRSGGAISYSEEWVGLQTQELLRAIIDRCMLYRHTWKAADRCRKALWEYEARAYRRKRQEHNREKPQHEETIFPYGWEDIEHRDIGDDGHIPYLESEILYYGYFGCETEPIPGADPFTVECDPVYLRTEQKMLRST